MCEREVVGWDSLRIVSGLWLFWAILWAIQTFEGLTEVASSAL